MELTYLSDLKFIDKKLKLKRKCKFSNEDFSLLENCLDKCYRTIQDLNFIFDKKELTRNDIICIFIYLAWLYDIQDTIFGKLQKYNKTKMEKDKNFDKYRDFIKALRNFVSAHPIGECENKKFSELANYKCLDVLENNNSFTSMLSDSKVQKEKITIDGIKKVEKLNERILLWTNKKFTLCIIEVSIQDIFNSANCFIERIKQLDNALFKTFKISK